MKVRTILPDSWGKSKGLTVAETAAMVEGFREFANQSLGIPARAWADLEASMLYGGGSDTFAAITRRWANMAQNETNEQRFRSFCERYVIERASSFRQGHEEEDQWTAMLNAKSAYRKIQAMGRGIAAEDEALRARAQAEEEQLRAKGQGQSAGMMAGGATTHRMFGKPQAPVNSKQWTGYEEIAQIHDETTYRYRGGKWSKRK